MVGKVTPSHYDTLKQCGICKRQMTRKRYNKSPKSVVMQDVYLCERCDLTPDPPVRLR